MGGRKKSKKHVQKPEFFRLANAGLTTGFATDVAAWTLQFQGDNTWGDIAVVQPPQPTGHDWDSTSPTSNSASSGNTTRVTSPDNELRQSSNLEKLVWPKKDSVTVGPYSINERAPRNVLAYPPHDQFKSHLLRFLSGSGMAEMIIDILFEDHSTMWKLAFTCQKALAVVRGVIEVWDMTLLYFNGCEKAPTLEQTKINAAITSKKTSTKKKEKGEKDLTESDIARLGMVRSNLVIAYLRGPERTLMETCLYEAQVNASLRLCETVKWRGDHFKRVHLHRLPFLTTDLLRILVPQMTNLEMLGVYRCPLIHVGCAMQLLEIITLDRMKGREHQVSLDFYPRFHIGPVIEDGNPQTIGGFGPTWDNWRLPTDIAIYAIVFRFAVQSKLQGIDVLSSHCQFRKWLEDGPCWDLDNTLKAISKAFHFDHIVAWQSPNRFKVVQPPKFHLDGSPIHEDDYYALYKDLVEAVVLIDQRNAVHGGDVKRFLIINNAIKPEEWQWQCLPYICTDCHTIMPGVFFDFKVIRGYRANPEFGRACLGCMLTEKLDKENDHFKQSKMQIMSSWVNDVSEDGDILKNTDDVAKLLEDFEKKKILKQAQSLDVLRHNFILARGFDRETQEVQKKIPKQVGRSLRGDFLSAPMLGEWQVKKTLRESSAQNPNMAPYNDGQATSYLRHSRHYG